MPLDNCPDILFDCYTDLGNLIKCNPAIKAACDRAALIQSLHEGRLDIIATDHAPHTWEEKQRDYPKAPAGLPLVQHALLTLFDQVARHWFANRTSI